MEKVILTKAQAEVFEKWEECGRFPAQLVSSHAQYPNDWGHFAKPVNGMALDTFIKAAYGFYEVEKTPHEELKHHVDEEKLMTQSPYRRGWLDGIYFTLNVLEIKIEGVNDTDEE